MKILVTGAKGFVGKNLCAQLKNIRDRKARNYGVSVSEVFEYDLDSTPEDLDAWCAAADFVFIDTQGKQRTLYGIPAERLLLIFGNPDCTACRQLMESMEEEPDIQALIASGSLKVVDIYIDEDVALWKARMAEYPASWINGYDPTFTIRNDLIYNVRALPSLYLLDRDKTVLAKDAEPADVMTLLLARP